MKKLILQNTLATQLLIYGGLALIMWPTMLRSLGAVSFGSTSGTIFLYAGLTVMLVGLALRLYQQQQLGQSALRSYLLRFVFGIVIVVVMMITGLVQTPAFLQDLF
ncbi:MAG: hypothetical protein LPK09_04880 [Hymenobacteraceae bacterium]|nr:hypothetical protein [Hymenobacteraceae bacterium]